MAMATNLTAKRAIAMATGAIALASLMTACAPKEDVVAPEESRGALVATVQDAAALLDLEGWNEDGAPGVQGCDADGAAGVKWNYGYGAPQPGGDRVADAQKVAEYWESLGMSVRIDTSSEPVVFAEGGPVQGVSFSTAPGDYYISGTSACSPGDADELREGAATE